jgi:hypothetical protein
MSAEQSEVLKRQQIKEKSVKREELLNATTGPNNISL